MRPTAELLALIPKELHSAKLRCTWHNKQDAWYVYRQDAVVYVPEKRRGVEKRTQLGRIKDGQWTYSPSWLKAQEIAGLKAELQEQQTAETTPCPDQTTQTVQTAPSAAAADTAKLKTHAKADLDLDLLLTVICLAMAAGHRGALSAADYCAEQHTELSRLFADFPDEGISCEMLNRLLRLIRPQFFLSLISACTAKKLQSSTKRLLHPAGQAGSDLCSTTESAVSGRLVLELSEDGRQLNAAKEMAESLNSAKLLQTFDLRAGDLFIAQLRHTPGEIIEYLRRTGCDWCLEIKADDKELTADAEQLFAAELSSLAYLRTEPQDGTAGCEIWQTDIMPGSALSRELYKLHPWLEAGTVIKVQHRHSAAAGGDLEPEPHLFISTLLFTPELRKKQFAQTLLTYSPAADRLHWMLNIDFDHDRMQASDRNYLANLSWSLKGSHLILGSLGQRLAQAGCSSALSTVRELCSTPMLAVELFSQYFADFKLPLTADAIKALKH